MQAFLDFLMLDLYQESTLFLSVWTENRLIQKLQQKGVSLPH